MNRKTFLKKCATLTAGVACMDLLTGCASLPYASYVMEGSTALVDPAEMEARGFVLLKIDRLPAPVYVTRLKDGSFSAVMLRCTHRGCTVKPAGTILQCPCHGSQYTPTGTVLEGPAPRALQRYPVTTADGQIRIQFS